MNRFKTAWKVLTGAITFDLEPEPPRDIQEAVRSIVPTETPFMKTRPFGRPHDECYFPECNCANIGACKFVGAPSKTPPWMSHKKEPVNHKCDCGATASKNGYCDGNCAFDEPKGDGVPTELPPPPPARPMPEDALLDAYEAAAREVEDNIRTMYAAYKIALDEGLGLVTEIRFRGEFERQRVRNQMELAKNLVVNFRERKRQLETPSEPAFGDVVFSAA